MSLEPTTPIIVKAQLTRANLTMADSAFHIILRYGNHFAAVFFDHEIFDARALIARRHEQLRRYVGLLAKRRGVIGIVCGRL
jgi:hypothetical protein